MSTKIIPKDWIKINLGVACDFERGIEPGADAYNTDGVGERFLRVAEVTESRDNPIYVDIQTAKKLTKNDIAFTLDGTVGAVKTGLEGIYSTGVRKVSFKHQNNSNRLLYYILQSTDIQKIIDLYASGSTIRHASSAIPHLTTTIPSSLIEQEKIAEILSAIDDAIEKTDLLIGKYKRVKMGMMQDLFRYGVDKNGEIRSERTARFKNSRVGRIPEEWKVEKIKSAVKFPTGQVDPRKSSFKEMILIAPDHVEQGTGKILEFKTTEEQGAISGKYFSKKGSVVYSKIRPNLAKVAFPNFDCLCSADMYPLLPATDRLLNTYLFFSLLTHRFTEFATISSARSNFPKINRSELGNYDLLVPEFEEQERISKLLTAANEAIEKEELYKQKLLSVKTGLMEDLLMGTTRVNDLIKK